MVLKDILVNDLLGEIYGITFIVVSMRILLCYHKQTENQLLLVIDKRMENHL